MDHASDTFRRLGSAGTLPNSCRQASLRAVTGFHSAKLCRAGGRDCNGTNVLAAKVAGESTMNRTVVTTSTVGGRRPPHAIPHEKAYENRSSSPKPASASGTDV